VSETPRSEGLWTVGYCTCSCVSLVFIGTRNLCTIDIAFTIPPNLLKSLFGASPKTFMRTVDSTNRRQSDNRVIGVFTVGDSLSDLRTKN
jgi:hypothetical protein